MVSSCVIWLYFCNPPIILLLSLHPAYTHTFTGSVSLSPEAQWKSSRSSHLEYTQHSGTGTCAHEQTDELPRQTQAGSSSYQRTSAFPAREADCKLHPNKQWTFFIFCFNSSLIHSSENWTVSSSSGSEAAGAEGLAGTPRRGSGATRGEWLGDRKKNEGTRCVSQIRWLSF